MDKKLFKSIFIPSVKIKSSDSNKTVFEVVGVPYGGPDYLGGKDLQGERFTKNTDFGKDLNGEIVVKTIYAFYDHAMNESIGKEQIGFAKFFQETDMGQVWDIEVSRAYRYHDFLLALAQKNLLGASSQPVQTAVEIDYETGDIKRWPLAEISLTPTPANPNAVMQVMKSLNMDFKMEVVVEEDVKKPEVEEEVPATTETEELPDLADVIEDAFQAEGEEPVADAKSIKSMMEDMQKMMDLVQAMCAGMEEMKSERKELVTNQKALAVEIGKINAGLKSFAVGVAKSLKTQVKQTIADLDKKSEVERELEGELEGEPEGLRPPVKSVIPAGAPGMNTKRSNQ